MPIRRQGGLYARIRSAHGGERSRRAFALAAYVMGLLSACTPIEPVQSGRDAGAASGGASRRDACHGDGDCVRSSACNDARCENGTCNEYPEADGVPLPGALQVVGDCRTLVCDGAGQMRTMNDDTDKLASDGNPCHSMTCRNGSVETSNVPDNTPCYNSGVCTAGVCSECKEGEDCTMPSHCTVHRTRCEQGKSVCDDTHELRTAVACQDGKVCDDGWCVPCTVGAECQVDRLCHIGVIVGCEGGVQCELRPVSGPACGMNSGGQRQYCVDGVCTLPCREGSCMSSSDPCRTSRWDCSDNAAAPSCVPEAQPEGTSCGDSASCHAGQCVRSALVNGSFTQGLRGWTASGDASMFQIASSSGKVAHTVLSTSSDGKNSGGSLRGNLSQMFTVPNDALALRYVIFGGHAHVLLKDAAGNTLEDCVGVDSDTVQVPVSWDLSARRGQQLVLSIEDDLGSGDGAYVSVSGFDVIRDVDAPLRNPQFAQTWAGWETTGDATHFNLFTDFNYYLGDLATGVPAYGMSPSVSTYGRDTDAPYGNATQGTLAQQFVVPDDAVALRFHVHGGRAARVALLDGTEVVRSVTGANADTPKLVVDWPLASERGKTLRLVIEDASTTSNYGYIGTSGFDLITSFNGP